MKRTILRLLITVLPFILISCNKYESVANDPTQTRIYTLDNGLKIYMSVNQDEPRIQADIAVRAGSKNDPHETTGLAHYLEHLMFKGTTTFGTKDYESEKPLLDQIEDLYEKYRVTTDNGERKEIYHQIDSISYLASSYTIANEYDKLMEVIGASGTNAYTDNDVTCYTENIPSNEIERWAKIQSDRFKNMVIRGFHTELETVYEEFNMCLTDDNEKCWDKMNSLLCKKHPYGTQNTIGTQEHLKNPSIKNIKEFFNTWYVPNNIAICLAGDFDPESTLKIIEKYFGDWKPSDETPKFTFEPEDPMTEPVYADVIGQENENIWIGWRFPGANDIQTKTYLDIIAELLYNGKTGLLDVNLVRQQKILGASAHSSDNTDYSRIIITATPNKGQSLEEVKELLIENVDKLAAGDFEEELLESIINAVKRSEMMKMERNIGRVNTQVDAFINGTKWKDVVNVIDRISKITKQQIVDFAKQHLNNGYAVIYKRQGIDTSVSPIEKPSISPIQMNRECESAFFKEVSEMEPEGIQPKFVDFDKELSKADIKGNDFLYVQNKTNGLFELRYEYSCGAKADRLLDIIRPFFAYLRTEDMSEAEIQKEFYKLACDYYIYAGSRYTRIGIYGLAENQEKAISLLEKIITKGYIEPEKFEAVREQVIKKRLDSKTSQQNCFSALEAYATCGPYNLYTHTLSNDELMKLTAEDITNTIHKIFDYKQTISYYTPIPAKDALANIESNHKIADNPIPESEGNYFKPLTIEKPELFIAPYQAANINLCQISSKGETLDIASYPVTRLFNAYFYNVVYQELRESRGLCYAAYSDINPHILKKGGEMVFYRNITTQNDKLYESVKTFDEITEELPISENSFEASKQGILKNIASSRTIKTEIFSRYKESVDLGIDHDINEYIYKAVSEMTLEDVKRYHAENIKNRTYRTVILGDEKQLDPEVLKTLGEVHRLALEDIFGY